MPEAPPAAARESHKSPVATCSRHPVRRHSPLGEAHLTAERSPPSHARPLARHRECRDPLGLERERGEGPAHLGVALGPREGRAPLPNPCAPRLSSPAPTRGGRCWRLNSTCSFWSFPTAPPPCSRTLLAARSLWVIFWRIWRGPRPPTLGRWQFPRGSPPEWSFPRQRPLSEGSPEFGISLPPSRILGIRIETDYPESSSLLSPKLSPRRNLSHNCLSCSKTDHKY